MSIAKKTTQDYYREKFIQHGDTPKGVDWNDSDTQNLRFKQILEFVLPIQNCSLLDVGCGTGALFEYIKNNSQDDFFYTGTDYVEEMIDKATSKFDKLQNVIFLNKDLSNINDQFDYVVASGIFNVKQNISNEIWKSHILDTLDKMFSRCKKGIVFNILTSYVDFSESRLYYSDPLVVFDYCVKSFSRYIKLNQGYPLYEYTMAVYKDDYVKSLKNKYSLHR